MALFFSITFTTTAFGSDRPRFPESEAEWTSMTAAEKAAVMDYLGAKLDQMLAEGTAFTDEISDSSIILVTPALLSGRTEMANSLAAVTVWRNCYVRWTTFPGEGDWVQGGGITDASATITGIYAGKATKKGQFLRDGVLQANWYNERWPGDHAENWSSSTWTFWWETSNWVTKGWHGAYNNGTWLLGPDNYCYVSKTL